MSLGNSTNYTCGEINLEGVYRSVAKCYGNKTIKLWEDTKDRQYVRILSGEPDPDSDLVLLTASEFGIVEDFLSLLSKCPVELASECPDTFCREIVGRGNPELAGIGVGKPVLDLLWSSWSVEPKLTVAIPERYSFLTCCRSS
jgi:hypothetical protein